VIYILEIPQKDSLILILVNGGTHILSRMVLPLILSELFRNFYKWVKMTIKIQFFRDFSVSNSRPTSKADMTDLETRMSKNVFIFEINMIDSP